MRTFGAWLERRRLDQLHRLASRMGFIVVSRKAWVIATAPCPTCPRIELEEVAYEIVEGVS